MKKLNLAFGITAITIVAIGLIHGIVAWITAEIMWDKTMTSMPTWTAFVLPLLCYGIAVAMVLFVWVFAALIVRKIQKK